jgi:hypothetical protein
MHAEPRSPDPGDFAPILPPPAPSPPDPRVQLVADVLQFATGVKSQDIIEIGKRSAAKTRVRHIAMYLFSTVYGEPAHRTAQAFGRERSTALLALRRIEEDRTNPAFNAWMDSLETALLAAPRGGRA